MMAWQDKFKRVLLAGIALISFATSAGFDEQALAKPTPKKHAAIHHKKVVAKKPTTRKPAAKKPAPKKSTPTRPAAGTLPAIRQIQPSDFRAPGRWVNRIGIHHTGVDDSRFDNPNFIRQVHRSKGWDDAGYHFMIDTKGRIWTLRDINAVPAAQQGMNPGTIAIVYHGHDPSHITDAQEKSMRALCAQINKVYKQKVTFHGHKEFNNFTAKKFPGNFTECPDMNYKALLQLDSKGKMPLALKEWHRVSPAFDGAHNILTAPSDTDSDLPTPLDPDAPVGPPPAPNTPDDDAMKPEIPPDILHMPLNLENIYPTSRYGTHWMKPESATDNGATKMQPPSVGEKDSQTPPPKKRGGFFRHKHPAPS